MYSDVRQQTCRASIGAGRKTSIRLKRFTRAHLTALLKSSFTALAILPTSAYFSTGSARMPLFKSFRSKSSSKSSASVLSGNDDDRDVNTDFGPTSSSVGSFRNGSKKSKKSLDRSTKQTLASLSTSTSLSKHPIVPQSMSTSTLPTTTKNNEKSHLMEAVSSVDVSTPPIAEVPPVKPRPSEMFAGKGVQWDSVKLAGPGSAPAEQNRSTTSSSNEDLQRFLKL